MGRGVQIAPQSWAGPSKIAGNGKEPLAASGPPLSLQGVIELFGLLFFTFAQRDDLFFVQLLDPGHRITRAALGEDQLVELGMERDVAAMGIDLALVLTVEHHLRKRDRQDGQCGGEQIGRQSKPKPSGTEQDHPDLHQWTGEQVRHDSRHLAPYFFDAALLLMLAHGGHRLIHRALRPN